jgi:RND family efflux transporter MFP subunit
LVNKHDIRAATGPKPACPEGFVPSMLDSPTAEIQHSTQLRQPLVTPARRRSWPWLAVLLLLSVAGIWYLASGRSGGTPPVATATAEPPPALSVAVIAAAPRDMPRIVSGDGSVVAWQELVLGAEAGGLRVTEVAVEEGDRVRAGQVLVRLDDAVPAAQLAQSEAAMAEADAALAIARSDLNRATELSRTQNTPRQVLDQRQSAARQAEARLASARAGRDEAQARLAQTRLRAPTDGIVLKRTALPGAVIGLGQEMIRLLRDGRLELDARVLELDLATIAPGQPVRVLHGTREIVATVRAIAPGVAQETRLGIVHIALPEGSGLLPGMFARAEIRGEAPSRIAVPQEAVVFRDGAPAAFVVKDGHVSLRRLTTGQRQAGMVEVLDGLAAGDQVVATGAGFLADGDRVRVTESLAAGR